MNDGRRGFPKPVRAGILVENSKQIPKLRRNEIVAVRKDLKMSLLADTALAGRNVFHLPFGS